MQPGSLGQAMQLAVGVARESLQHTMCACRVNPGGADLSPLPTSPIVAACQPVGMMSDKKMTFSSGRPSGTLRVFTSAAAQVRA